MPLQQDFNVNASLTITEEDIFFSDLEEMEPREQYLVSATVAENLQRSADISFEEAAYLLGKTEQICANCSTRQTKVRRINSDRLIDAFTIILRRVDANAFYDKLSSMKYHEIERVCKSDYPFAEYLNL